MTLPDSKLRLPIVLLFVSLVLGTGIFHFSLKARLAAEVRLLKEKTLADQSALGVHMAPARLIQDKAEAELYASIRNSGFIGPENRVGWISALAQTRELLQLTSLSWHLSPQTSSTLAPNLRLSRLEFTATPLDPASLTRLIAHLRATAPGRFTVEHCALSFEIAGDNGQANCHLNWWTLAQGSE